MALTLTLTKAVGTLTLTDVFVDTQTVVVGGKTYTTQDTLTDSDGNVKIGADAEECIDNLVAAINLAAGAGTAYAASMTANTQVSAAKSGTDKVVVTALQTGTLGNLIASTETQTNASWGGATLASGAGSIATALAAISAEVEVHSAAMTAFRSGQSFSVNSGVDAWLRAREALLDANKTAIDAEV